MLSPKEVSYLLVDRRLDIVSKATGVHRNTIQSIRDNPSCNPSYRVMKALSDYLLATGTTAYTSTTDEAAQ